MKEVKDGCIGKIWKLTWKIFDKVVCQKSMMCEIDIANPQTKSSQIVEKLLAKKYTQLTFEKLRDMNIYS